MPAPGSVAAWNSASRHMVVPGSTPPNVRSGLASSRFGEFQVTPQCSNSRRRWLEKLRKPWPTHLIFLLSRLMASMSPLEQPLVACQARISACQVRTTQRSDPDEGLVALRA